MTATQSVRHAGLFALHQMTVLAGILLFPVVIATRRLGLPLPVGRAVERVCRAYGESTAEAGETDR